MPRHERLSRSKDRDNSRRRKRTRDRTPARSRYSADRYSYYRDRSGDRRDGTPRRRGLSRSPRGDRLNRRRDGPYSRRDGPRDVALDQILARLGAIEDKISESSTAARDSSSRNIAECHTPPLVASTPVDQTNHLNQQDSQPSTENRESVADQIVGALSALAKVKSHNYYVSPFDPNIHDFDVWCAEVDRAQQINKWDERECLGRIGSCLRGDAKSWLNDWVINIRTWSNFKQEFRSLCPRNVDIATVLYDVMCTNSNKFPTYAEYARKSLLRLNIVSGLSDELKTAIVIRGISDPQIKAAASNAKLQSKQLVEFLSVYVKPKLETRNTHTNRPVSNTGSSFHSERKRESPKSIDNNIACHFCGKLGHKKDLSQETVDTKVTPSTSKDARSSKFCTYCKRNGHVVESCFQNNDRKTRVVRKLRM